MAIKLITPNKTYQGNLANVQFYKGEGIFENEKLGKRLAKQFGYRIEEIKSEKTEKVEKVKAEKTQLKQSKKVEE